MKNIKLESNSNIDTIKIAQKLAGVLSNGDLVILTGELGSGKTKFTEGFLSFYKIEDEISSPTFNIVNEYTSNNINIYHFDVYRLTDSDEFYEIGGEEYFDKGICLIEWGEIIKDILPNKYLEIKFEKDINNDNKRILNLNAIGTKYEKILDLFNKTI